ncbi:MAG: diacylglycerol kinase [Candidatus Parcubacteria bacterium]|nr:MAG: diacylglycerol kinase [Candidatus Parcubacteria bacterium]
MKYAIKGLNYAFKHHRHFKIELFVVILVIILSFIFDLNTLEFLSILFAIVLVLISEIFNNLIKETLNFVYQEYHQKVKFIKDLSARAVLIAVIYSLIVGIIIFLPKIFSLFIYPLS